MNAKSSIVALLVVCLLLVLGFQVIRAIENSSRNAYALWWVGSMVVDHLKSNSDEWPTCWDDLRDDYDAGVELSGQPCTFDELRNQVEVDWDIDPRNLRELPPLKDGNAPFRVVRLRDGREVYYHGREPNRMIHRYLQKLPPEP